MIADVSSASNLVEEALAMMMIRFFLRRDGCKLPVYPFRSGGEFVIFWISIFLLNLWIIVEFSSDIVVFRIFDSDTCPW